MIGHPVGPQTTTARSAADSNSGNNSHIKLSNFHMITGTGLTILGIKSVLWRDDFYEILFTGDYLKPITRWTAVLLAIAMLC